MAEPQYCGTTYRQLSQKLRIHRPGQPDKVSERPRQGSQKEGWGAFLDEPPNPPTLITFDPADQVDVAQLLRIGAVVPYCLPELADGEEGG